jgi:predicted PurR-regulated permease PerM
METDSYKKIAIPFILLILLILSYFLLKPILMAVFLGVILAIIFLPLYKKLLKLIKFKDVSAFIVCILLIIIIVVPLWFLTPVLVNQSIDIFMSSQNIDFVTPLKKIFPSLFATEQFSNEIGSILSSFTTKITSSIMGGLSNLILNFPIISLQLLVVFFVFFYVMRDEEKIIEYLQSILPFPKEIEQKLFKSSKEVTLSVLYGVIVLGIVQGLVVGVGFFLFSVPNALFLTIAAILAGILPIIGTTLVWGIVVIFMVINGSPLLPILGICFFGFLAYLIDHFFKPVFISRRTKLHSVIVLLGMVGGIIVFGFFGFVIGPLILSYLLIVLEIYKSKKPQEQ